MNLINIAQSGLSSAQAALNVVGNNINNAYNGDSQDPFIQGYARRNIVLGEAGGRSTPYGFFGYGVQVNDVARAYNSFISNQVRGAASEYTALNAHYEQLSQIDNMFGNDTQNISVSLSNIFGALEKMSHDPVNPAARQEALSQFKTLASQFRSNSSTLNSLEKSTNKQIAQSVEEINAYTAQLAKINEQINKIHGQTGGLPADLLDQRDNVLTRLSELTGIQVNENSSNGTVNVTLTNGMSLVNGNRAYQLETSTSAENPAKTVVSYIDAAGNRLPLDENRMSEGKLGGLFKFRNEDLVEARNELNQLALQMANKFNEVNKQGYDLDGNPGSAIFSFADPVALANQQNSGNASLAVSYSDISQVAATDYAVTFNGTAWEVTRADGSTVTPVPGADGSLQFDGITIKPQGTPQPGDSFILNPVSGAADSLQVAISDGDAIAASGSANPDEESNNENLQMLLGIKNEKVIGDATLSEAYASMASRVGSSTSALKGAIESSGSAADEFINQQQALSGVDLNEEMVNMQMFTQYYQANAQILQTATTLFDTLLNLR
ncbi:flagellar hook-associated protein FlgK [[Erwinia] mediterraneensis]|uniref:flagellar hook-associated protein FlgK n=1 Tax=[Erwinia] mediterraneensis TaxID=2161819 RepID=UPI001030FB9A|nr:flagellar hook-associated protein FlgK [[Erwinia] mediterraneensis]